MVRTEHHPVNSTESDGRGTALAAFRYPVLAACPGEPYVSIASADLSLDCGKASSAELTDSSTSSRSDTATAPFLTPKLSAASLYRPLGSSTPCPTGRLRYSPTAAPTDCTQSTFARPSRHRQQLRSRCALVYTAQSARPPLTPFRQLSSELDGDITATTSCRACPARNLFPRLRFLVYNLRCAQSLGSCCCCCCCLRRGYSSATTQVTRRLRHEYLQFACHPLTCTIALYLSPSHLDRLEHRRTTHLRS